MIRLKAMDLFGIGKKKKEVEEDLSTATLLTDPEQILNLSSFNDRNLYLTQEIDMEISNSIEASIRFFNRIDDEDGLEKEDRQPIKIYINSGGGSLAGTMTMVNTIINSTTPVYTICTGVAYSGAFITFIVGHKRYAYKYSQFMTHEGSISLPEPMDANKALDMINSYIKELNVMEDIILNHTQISKSDYDLHKKDDWYMFAEEAKKLNVVDEIVDKKLI